MEILNVEDLTFTYPGVSKPALNNIGLKLYEGEFAVLCGSTGSGKSTLLKLLKEELRPQGDFKGSITFAKDDIRIGFVAQNPHEQAVTDKVWNELVFGMENGGYTQTKMAARAAEMAGYFGITEWYDKSVNELSGGQLQLLNLASVMVTDPDILILDEPTAQLDPVATSDFFEAVRKLNRDFAVTVIIAEHRLEELLQADDRLLVMAEGRICTDGRCRDVIGGIKASSPLFDAFPTAYRLYESIRCGRAGGEAPEEGNRLSDTDMDTRDEGKSLNGADRDTSIERNYQNRIEGETLKDANFTNYNDKIPLTVREGRDFIRKLIEEGRIGQTAYIKSEQKTNYADTTAIKSGKTCSTSSTGVKDGKSFGEKACNTEKNVSSREKALEIKNVYYRYDRFSADVLSCFDLTVYSGEIFCILGGNASGKTTALNAAAGLIRPYSGMVKIFGKKLRDYKNESLYNNCVAMLPQDVQTLFMYNTVREELEGMGKSAENAHITELLKPMYDIDAVMDKHPYDLSGGEQQIVGLTKVLYAHPKLLLADEPTTGIDAGKKRIFAGILRKLKDDGITTVIVTHDAEFAALCADRCALCFRGAIVSVWEPEVFFTDNAFYTTTVSRMTKGILERTVTLEAVLRRLL
ncbi:MAG: ABC transporter ATP-binding protein [Lachnospiraceae bacterium]|nr:ABC transporter ATP-binding protein [Lachnospiraceae bacterium]